MTTRSIPPRSGRRNDVIGPPAARSRRLRFAPAPRGAAVLAATRRSASPLTGLMARRAFGLLLRSAMRRDPPPTRGRRLTSPSVPRDEALRASRPPTESLRTNAAARANQHSCPCPSPSPCPAIPAFSDSQLSENARIAGSRAWRRGELGARYSELVLPSGTVPFCRRDARGLPGSSLIRP